MENRPPLAYGNLKKYLLNKGITKASYEEVLWTNEWLSFRDDIKARDKFTCTACKKCQFRLYNDDELKERNPLISRFFSHTEKAWISLPEPHQKSTLQIIGVRDNDVKLEVHHKFYIWGKLPWEYDLEVLTTLCDSCHELEHLKIPLIYSDTSLKIKKVLIPCGRCNGRGYIHEFKHVQGGICFKCGGLGGIVNGTDFNGFELT